MMNEIDLTGLIDDRNKQLWEEVCAKQSVQVQPSDKGCYAVLTSNDEAIVYFDDNNRDPAAFTHELLHIKERLKGNFVGGALIRTVRAHSNLNKIMTDNLLEQIGNSLCHQKMLPSFLEMGYPENEFIADYYERACRTEVLYKSFAPDIELKNPKAIDAFIGLVITMRTNPSQFDHTKDLKELKRSAPNLYEIIDKFLIGWDNCDCTSDDFLKRDYNVLVFDFVEAISDWYRGNQP